MARRIRIVETDEPVVEEPPPVSKPPARRLANKTSKTGVAPKPPRRRPIEDEWFDLNKLLLRYTERLSRLRRDERFRPNAALLAEKYDSDLARIEMLIKNARRDFGIALGTIPNDLMENDDDD